MIEAVVNLKDGTQTRIYAYGFEELFAELDKIEFISFESATLHSIALSDLRQGRDGRRSV